MRSSVSYMLSESGREPAMSHPDYEQQAHDHGNLLVMIRGIGTSKPETLQKVFDRIQRINILKIPDSSNQIREICVRYIWDYPVENNDWGDFMTHRRLLGLISIGRYENQTELNELCRVHESLKVKYTSTLFDTRCLVFRDSKSSVVFGSEISTPSNFKSRALFYEEDDSIHSNLEEQIEDFISGLFWILESKRLEKTREKLDRIVLLTAPFEAKDFVGLDMESRNNKKRCMGRATKHLGDLTLQSGLIAESLNLFYAASETLRAIGDSLWLGAAYEGLCSASVIFLYPHLRSQLRHTSLSSPEVKRNSTSSISSSSSINSSSSSSSETGNANIRKNYNCNKYPTNILNPDEITSRYRDAIIHYSKYRHAGIIETEAALKAARICIEQNQKLDVSMFLQNVLYINLNMSESERVRRFETLTELYQRIGYQRKAAFCQRLAAWRHVAQSNSNPDWNQSYRLMLDSFPGHKLSLEPSEVLLRNTGWPVLQIDLLQQLVSAARRLGQSALATRHMTFLLQTMWKHLTQAEQAEMAMQLQNLSSQCEGSPVALHLDNGKTIPPSNLTDLPYCSKIMLKNLATHWRPQKLTLAKVDSGPFLFTPIHFGSIERREKTGRGKVNFDWVQKDLCEVVLHLHNPLPFELTVADMRLLTRGVVFESYPQTVLLQPNVPTTVTLQGTPIESGELIVHGYSTHTLGTKSNCEFRDMLDRNFSEAHIVNVIPCLPRILLSASAPQSTSISSKSDVLASSLLTLYNGETQTVTITITNTSSIPLQYLECSIHSSSVQINQIIRFCEKDLQTKLPILANDSLEFVVTIFGEADFVGPPPPDLFDGALQSLQLPFQQQKAITQFEGPRRSEVNTSYRGGSSGQSSLNTASLGTTTGQAARQFEAQLRFRYTGGDGLDLGYCRQGAISFNISLLPSAQVTNWDVLPAEIASNFYLVLDVSNLTNQEMTLNYTENKTILIEAKETCRVPVSVKRCDLDQLVAAYHSSKKNEQYQDNVNVDEIDLLERLCAEHISKSVNLKWYLATETTGVATLKGISLSNAVLDLITIAPLQWEVSVNSTSIPPQSEVTCTAGQCLKIGIKVCNVSSTPLQALLLSVQFYQDCQNGMHNYRLETRVIMSGPYSIEIPVLSNDESTSYECTVLFLTSGRFKADIQCRSSLMVIPNKTTFLSNTEHQFSHIWRFIPPIEIAVVE